MKLINKKILYNTVLSQVFSSCQKYLFVGNNFGDVFVLSSKDFTTSNEYDYVKTKAESNSFEPIHIQNLSTFPINSLAFHRGFLIVGTVGSISGYKWDEQKLQITKKAWEVNIRARAEAAETSDINYLLVDEDKDYLFVGCGDNNIYIVSLEDGKIGRDFKGHKDYIHCLTRWDNNLYSASEDGSILFWDVREQKSTGRIEPYKMENLVRPEYGKWQGTVSVTNDWLICGGGPKASMWHPRSMECTNVLPYPCKVHCSSFLDDMIIIAGEHQFAHQYSFNGDKIGEIPISGASVYSLVWQNEPYKFMSLGGSNNALDICTNFNYRDIIIKLYRAEK